MVFCFALFFLYRHNYAKLKPNKGFLKACLFILLPSSSLLHFLFLLYNNFFPVNSIKWAEIVLLNTRTSSSHQTSTEGANNLARNKTYAMNTQWHCELLSYAYVPILHFEVGSNSQPLSGAVPALSSHLMHCAAHPSLLHRHLSSQHCWGARGGLGLAQPDMKHSCKHK